MTRKSQGLKVKRKDINYRFFIAFIFIVLTYTGFVFAQPEKGFTSWLPAPNSDNALLIGNGTMGAMVFGHPHNETIILNHSSLYLPTGLPKKPIKQAGLLPEIRELILQGNGEKAAMIPVEQSLKEGYGGQIWSDPYIPAFDIKIKTDPENILNYKRSLNFETGEAIVLWEQSGNKFVRKQFISRADSILVLRMEALNPFNTRIEVDRREIAWNQWEYINNNISNTEYSAKENYLFYTSEFTHQWEENIAGYYGVGKVVSHNGEILADGNSIKVYGATELVLILKIKSYVKGEHADITGLKHKLDNFEANYEVLLEHHKKIHSEIFNRVSFSLNENAGKVDFDTEVMMQKAKDINSTGFIEKLFYASRYNILSATGKNPPNLQGIWGSSWQPPWASDYTHDGNLPVAISSFLVSNMPELMMSYFDYHDARLSDYRDNAKYLYDCRGIQIPSHTSSHGWNVHFDKTWCLTFWNGGAAWAAHFYYDYWRHTNDKDFLLTRAYPFMKEVALFYEDFLTLGNDGKYVFNPSYSPENNPANNPSQATINATMDVMLAKELFRNIIQAAQLVDEDKKQVDVWRNILAKLPAYEVDSSGVLREWLWPAYTENHHHRHISQLYGLYDIIDPEIAADSLLLEGARKVIEERMKVRRQESGGIMVFGLVQMAWVAANLGDEALVAEIINWLSSQYWSNSLASYHDPNGLFNMDLSGGYQTAIIKALVYSESGLISILPAKPKDWETGSITGLNLRGQVEMKKLAWTNELVRVELLSPLSQEIKVKLPDDYHSVKLTMGGKIIDFNTKENTATIALKREEPVELQIKK